MDGEHNITYRSCIRSKLMSDNGRMEQMALNRHIKFAIIPWKCMEMVSDARLCECLFVVVTHL